MARVFHPVGIMLRGQLDADPAFAGYFGAGSQPVTGRLSKALGTPGRTPDILGLALRFRGASGERWDLALATTLSGPVSRFALVPATAWRNASYGSLMPYRFAGLGLRWLFATADSQQPPTAALTALTDHLRGHDLRFRITAAAARGPARTAATVTLISSTGQHDESFDPARFHPANVTLAPALLARVRKRAYEGSRIGRHAGRISETRE